MLKTAQYLKKSVLKLFHGTTDNKLDKIKTQGLKNTTSSSEWYMLASHIDDAIYHSEKSTGKPIVIEYAVPCTNEQWEGYPYLWVPASVKNGKWYAVKDVLPSKFIKRIIHVSDSELKRVKGVS